MTPLLNFRSEEVNISNGKDNDCNITPKPNVTLRTALPQCAATGAVICLMTVLGTATVFPTVALPRFTSANSSAEDLRLSAEEGSWLGSVSFITPPFGCLASGFLLQPLGRRFCLLISSVIIFFGWLLTWLTPNFSVLITARILIGFIAGFMEAPSACYLGEIVQPELLGMLASSTSLGYSIGALAETLLGALINSWKHIAAVSTIISVVPALAFMCIPESPLWFLIHNKQEKAVKALMWLRNATHSSDVEKELARMNATLSDHLHTESNKNQWTYLRKRRTLHPFLLISSFFVFSQLIGCAIIQIYMVSIFQELGSPIEENASTTIVFTSSLAGIFVCSLLSRWYGRRPLMLSSCFSATVMHFGIALYGLFHDKYGFTASWIPLCLITGFNFCARIGIQTVPWILLAEAFPPEGRGLACGLCVIIFYCATFITVKSYIYILKLVTVAQTFWIYATICLVGSITFYFVMPETAGVSHTRSPQKGLDEKEITCM